MASIFDRIERRDCYPVSGCDLFVREPLVDEVTRALAVTTEHQKAMLFAFCVVNKDGLQLMPRNESESDSDFASRAYTEVSQMRGTVFAAVNAAITELLKPADPDDLAKKS